MSADSSGVSPSNSSTLPSTHPGRPATTLGILVIPSSRSLERHRRATECDTGGGPSPRFSASSSPTSAQRRSHRDRLDRQCARFASRLHRSREAHGSAPQPLASASTAEDPGSRPAGVVVGEPPPRPGPPGPLAASAVSRRANGGAYPRAREYILFGMTASGLECPASDSIHARATSRTPVWYSVDLCH